MNPTEPLMHRADDGTVTLELPDPPAASYPVTTELLAQWVATVNAERRWRNLATQLAEALEAVLDVPVDFAPKSVLDEAVAALDARLAYIDELDTP